MICHQENPSRPICSQNSTCFWCKKQDIQQTAIITEAGFQGSLPCSTRKTQHLEVKLWWESKNLPSKSQSLQALQWRSSSLCLSLQSLLSLQAEESVNFCTLLLLTSKTVAYERKDGNSVWLMIKGLAFAHNLVNLSSSPLSNGNLRKSSSCTKKTTEFIIKSLE